MCAGRVNESPADIRENFARGGTSRAIFPPYDRILGTLFYARV